MSQLSNIEEQELLQLLRSNDPRGLEILWDRYASVLYGLIFRIVQMDEVAEKVLLDCFREIQTQIGQYEPRKGRLFNWVIHLVHRMSIDTLKTHDYMVSRRSIKFERSGNHEPQKNDGYYPDAARIRDVIRRMDADHRSALELFYLDGLSVKDVATKLNTGEDAAKVRARDAVRKLRQYLEILK